MNSIRNRTEGADQRRVNQLGSTEFSGKNRRANAVYAALTRRLAFGPNHF